MFSLLGLLLWFACRHHVGEVILTHVWKNLAIEAPKSPESSLFQRFKSNFSAIPSQDKENFDFPEVPTALINKRAEIIDLCKRYQQKHFCRGDYKELVQLTLLALKDLDAIEDFTGFNFPGAMSKARWMAKLLYAIKMILLASKIAELPKGSIFARGQLPKLQRFVQFVIFCYVPWWLTSPVPSSAPKNDQLLLNSLIEYKDLDSSVADVALKAFGKHLWYLTEELVPLAFFSSTVDASVKAKMARKLMEMNFDGLCQSRIGLDSGFGKPRFPSLPADSSNDLSVYVGKDSWSFFKILRFQHSFLSLPVEQWSQNADYKRAKVIVDALRVANDAAERGVKGGGQANFIFFAFMTFKWRYTSILHLNGPWKVLK